MLLHCLCHQALWSRPCNDGIIKQRACVAAGANALQIEAQRRPGFVQDQEIVVSLLFLAGYLSAVLLSNKT